MDSFIEGELLDAKLVLVMEFIDGPTLREDLAQTWYDEASVVEVMRSVLEVLRYLHSRSPAVVHGDIKPDNIIRRTRDGALILIDFGIARAGAQETGTLTLKGTHGYAAPEAYAGTLTPSGDLYALGALAVRLLTNRNLDELSSNRHLGLHGWQSLVNISDELHGLIESLLAVSPRMRPKSAKAVLERLDAMGDPASTSGGPTAQAPDLSAVGTRQESLEESQRRLALQAERLAKFEVALDEAAAPVVAQIDEAWAELEPLLVRWGPDEPERAEALIAFLDAFDDQRVTVMIDGQIRTEPVECESLRLARQAAEGSHEVLAHQRTRREALERAFSERLHGAFEALAEARRRLDGARGLVGRFKAMFGGDTPDVLSEALERARQDLHSTWQGGGRTTLDCLLLT